MLPWPLLSSVLFLFFLCSSLLTITAQAQDSREDLASPLMIMRRPERTPENPEEESSPDKRNTEEQQRRLTEDSEAFLTQPRGNLVQKGPQEKSLSSYEEQNEATSLAGPIGICIQHYNRADDIAKKKSAYEQELSLLSPDSDRAKMLIKLIPLFEQARSYQNDMGRHLKDYRETFKKTGGPDAVFLESMMKINSSPNKVERLIAQIENDYQSLARCQKQLLKVRKEIIDLQHLEWPVPKLLTETVRAFDESILCQRNLIQLRVGSARFIQPPYKKTIDAVIQNQLEANKARITKAQTLAEQQSLLANRRYNQSFGHSFLKGDHFDRAINMIRYVAEEMRREQPRQQIIDCFSRSIELSQQAAIALRNTNDPNREKGVGYLSNESSALSDAAHEARSVEPQQQVINCFLRSSELFKEAVAALDNTSDLHREERATYFDNAAVALSNVAREAQKEQPDEEVIRQEVASALRWQNKAKNSAYASCCTIQEDLGQSHNKLMDK
ncbi:MAG: hypothetical protein NT164_04450 [Verrucomicrobiae bacterium]|nr:hypothetical protein [Verrucomicrobiae bacterium]